MRRTLALLLLVPSLASAQDAAPGPMGAAGLPQGPTGGTGVPQGPTGGTGVPQGPTGGTGVPQGPTGGTGVFRQVGSLTIAVDRSHAYPGGLLVVLLHSRHGLGTSYAILDGKRTPFYSSPKGPRALVPVSATAIPGEATLGIEIIARGRQRIPVQVAIGPREFTSRAVVIPEDKRYLLEQPARTRDSRRLLAALRTVSPARQWAGPLRAPVDVAPAATFGSPTTYVGGSPVEAMMDGIYGEYHRGLDYGVPPGTLVQAPGAGTVVLAAALTLTGQTLVIDHGEGVLSAIFHLGRLEVREGDHVEARSPVGLSGDTGLALTPHVHWGTYVSGVAVDPRVVGEVLN